jgi:hypothetical protein
MQGGRGGLDRSTSLPQNWLLAFPWSGRISRKIQRVPTVAFPKMDFDCILCCGKKQIKPGGTPQALSFSDFSDRQNGIFLAKAPPTLIIQLQRSGNSRQESEI